MQFSDAYPDPYPCYCHLKFSTLQRDTWAFVVNVLCMLPVERCLLHCAAERASMWAHMVACSSLQRAPGQGQYASLYGYLWFFYIGRSLHAALYRWALAGQYICKLVWFFLV